MRKSNKWNWARSGFTVVETMVAFAIGGVGLLAVSELVQNFYQSQKSVKSSVDLATFDSNMRLLLGKDVCAKVLGEGYKDPGVTDINANNFNPSLSTPQNVVLRNVETGAGVLFGVNTQVTLNHRIGSVTLTKVSDLNGGAPIIFRYNEFTRPPPSGVTVGAHDTQRRGMIGRLSIRLDNIPSNLPNPLPSPPADMATIIKNYDITFFVEQSSAGSPWKIGGCSDPGAMGGGNALGQAGAPMPSGTPSGVPAGCITVAAPGDNTWANCPAGTYVMSQLPIPIVRIACPACMKGTVCCYGYNVMQNQVMCCPILK